MIDLYYAATPNGQKLKLFFEESGLPYREILMRLGKGDQLRAAFRKISPNAKIPAMVDHAPADGGEPLAMFESGAMLLYLAEKSGQLLPKDARTRNEMMQWLFWQMSALGPMAGQNGHFRAYAPDPVPYALDRYTRETARLFGVLDKHLDGRDYIAGDYSIADISTYPWVVPHLQLGQQIGNFPHLKRWFDAIAARPAVQRAYEAVEPPYIVTGEVSEEERQILFGQAQQAARIAMQGDIPWVPLSSGKSFKPLRFLSDNRGFVEWLKLEPGPGLPLHRHTGEVHVYNLQGTRKLHTGELVNAGDYVYEPAGTVDAWTVEGSEPAIALVVVMGAVEYLDANHSVIATYDADKLQQLYRDFCVANGVEFKDLVG